MNNTKSLKSSKSFLVEIGLIAVAIALMAIPIITHAATLNRQLEIGMSGSDVSALQTFLAQDNTIYPQGLVTGYFGSLTKSAVSNFQARNGIDTVGRVGPITLAAINAQMGGGGGTTFNGQAPVIGPLSISTGSNSAVISWNTSENASAIVYYSTLPISMLESTGPGVAITVSGNALLVHSDLRSSHSANLTALQSNTRYNYVVYVRDGSGNETITWPSYFQTSN